ncbi:flagellar biosynthesis protein FlgE [Corallincola spongiicola]|uniref:Flagellar biosynthesis protein FlgE n=1 Tax=Corallincola spongiicola TaxID=2520508 RepID=A0ABY1WPP0_9GAMM|nr:flagellar biosynthesis protein FlgE [Corallincola spongiicola]TAA46058.1 flagellar biosynthesis protein FlgE [Corallincola spongiicola]
MEIPSAVNSGVEGLRRAEQSVAETANNIATQVVTPESEGEEVLGAEQALSLSEELVNLRVQEFTAKANAQVIQTADEVIGSLLDTSA